MGRVFPFARDFQRTMVTVGQQVRSLEQQEQSREQQVQIRGQQEQGREQQEQRHEQLFAELAKRLELLEADKEKISKEIEELKGGSEFQRNTVADVISAVDQLNEKNELPLLNSEST